MGRTNSMFPFYLLLTALLLIPVIDDIFAENYNVQIMPGSYQIGCQLKDNCLDHPSTTIVVGDSITWINTDIMSHQMVTVKSENDKRFAGNFDTGKISAGEQKSFTFRLNGIYNYHDPEYPWIVGTVIVKTGHTHPDFEWISESLFFSDIEGKRAVPTVKQSLYITNNVINIGDGDPPNTNFALSIYKGHELVYQGFEKMQLDSNKSAYATYTWVPKEPGKHVIVFTADITDYTLEVIKQNNLDYREILVYDGIAPPAIQEKYGISYDDITCDKELKLAKKKVNDSAICITESTLSVLLQRGYAHF